ncbi:MAG: hypothetical protein JWO60_2853, partial [Frankiales bacterium]|nr:hypothetical protein [Frankiales bacterium]
MSSGTGGRARAPRQLQGGPSRAAVVREGPEVRRPVLRVGAATDPLEAAADVA